MNKLLLFPRLYRFDVALITFISSFAGFYLNGDYLNFHSFFASLFISLILYNFVYVLNSIADYKEDAINKPFRPIPSGKLSLFAAKIWATILFVLSFVGSFFFFDTPQLYYSLAITGAAFLYSLPPLPLKNYPLLASFITAWGLGHPIFITSNPTRGIAAGAVIFAAFSATIFKDISDIEGDRAAGRNIITDTFSLKTLSIISFLSALFSGALFVWAHFVPAAIVPLFLAITVVITFKLSPEEKEKKLYKIMIRSGAISSITVFLFILLRGLI
ncbi:UbiA family prenyltransferase [bacterium]|nr:UbiA family prenyltransferase [bacterium]